MVFVQFKKSQKNSFIVSCPGDTLVKDVLVQLNQVNNLRIYLDRLVWSVQQLANKGVLRPAELQGISFEQFQKHKQDQDFKNLSEQMLQYAYKPSVQPPMKFVADKHFQRYGVIQPDEQKQILLSAAKIGRKNLQPKQQVTEITNLLQAIEKIRDAVGEVFPAYIGLPQWQPTLLILEEKLQLEVLESQNFELFNDKSSIWWAGKQLDKAKRLAEYSGKNQKTKIIIKLQKFGQEQPPREPPIDAQTYSKMVKYYYKKVEQNKQFQQKAVQNSYDKMQQQPTMKQKLYIQDSLKFRPF